MIIIDKESLDKLSPRAGWVVLEIPYLLHDEVVTAGGLHLNITSISGDAKARNSRKSGVVFAVPDATNGEFGGYRNLDPMVSVAVGDTVWFDYHHITEYLTSVKTGQECDTVVMKYEDRYFVLIPYGDLFVGERDGVKFGLNGLIIGRKVKKEKESSLEFKDEDDPNRLAVTVLPTIPDDRYYVPRVGDILLFRGTARPVDSELFNGDDIYFIRPQSVCGVLEQK